MGEILAIAHWVKVKLKFDLKIGIVVLSYKIGKSIKNLNAIKLSSPKSVTMTLAIPHFEWSLTLFFLCKIIYFGHSIQ